MAAWWESISLIEQIFVVIAVPSTLILIIQTILLIFGGGADVPDSGLGSDVSGFGEAIDLDMGGAEDPGVQQIDTHGLKLFSISSILTFLTVFGWSGVLTLGAGMHTAAAVALSALLGFAALYGMAALLRGLIKLQESGNADYRLALGKTARVYLTIPSAGNGQGKINLILGDALREYWAVTDGNEPIPTGASVRVIDLTGEVYTVTAE